MPPKNKKKDNYFSFVLRFAIREIIDETAISLIANIYFSIELKLKKKKKYGVPLVFRSVSLLKKMLEHFSIYTNSIIVIFTRSNNYDNNCKSNH